jgi:hypothetical protein
MKLWAVQHGNAPHRGDEKSQHSFSCSSHVNNEQQSTAAYLC